MRAWSQESLRRYAAADACSGFSEKLAQLLLPRLSALESLCHMQCGPGLVCLRLAPQLRRVLCADSCPEAVAWVQGQGDERGIENLEARVANGADLPGHWDCIYLENPAPGVPERFLHRCGRLLLVLEQETSWPALPENRRPSFAAALGRLDELQVPYTKTLVRLPWAQVFEDAEEARRLAQDAAAQNSGAGCKEDVCNRLVPTGNPAYPLCLPLHRDVIVVETALRNKGDTRNGPRRLRIVREKPRPSPAPG